MHPYYFINYNLSEENLFLIIFLGLVIIIFWVSLDIIRLIKKKEEKLSSLSTENELFLRISEDFEKQLKELVRKEIQKNVQEFKNELQKTSEEIIESYRLQFEKGRKEIIKNFLEVSEQISKEANIVEKEIAAFGQKAQEEFSQLSEFNLQTQRKISERAEKEIAKFKQTNLKNQEWLTNEIKKELEIFSKNFSQEFGKICQSSQEILKENLKETEKEIKNYKEERLKEIDQKIYRLLGEVAKKTIGKAIDLSTHEKLVMEALKKAKEEIF